MEPQITRLDYSHADDIARLHSGLFSDGWDPKSVRDILSLPTSLALGARQDHSLCGFVLCQFTADEAEILSIGVAAAAQRKGIGALLLQALLLHLREQGAKQLMLEVADDNRPAIALYEAFDFMETGRRKNYYTSGRARPGDAVIMCRGL